VIQPDTRWNTHWNNHRNKQGMDPHNERRVFSRIVRNACTPTAKQFFLITPKARSATRVCVRGCVSACARTCTLRAAALLLLLLAAGAAAHVREVCPR
jgi:hypothetical protein